MHQLLFLSATFLAGCGLILPDFVLLILPLVGLHLVAAYKALSVTLGSFAEGGLFKYLAWLHTHSRCPCGETHPLTTAAFTVQEVHSRLFFIHLPAALVLFFCGQALWALGYAIIAFGLHYVALAEFAFMRVFYSNP